MSKQVHKPQTEVILPSVTMESGELVPNRSSDANSAYPTFLGEMDRYLFAQSTHFNLYEKMGAHVRDGGTYFTVWAPNASQVSVVGDFNHWDIHANAMHRHTDSGLWELFIEGIGEGVVYKFAVHDAHGHLLPLKADPYGFAAEMRPANASKVFDIHHFAWSDADYLAQRDQVNPYIQPISIYEVHLGSWQRDENGLFLSYDELAIRLIAYVKDLGFTHIEIMPVSEHPLDASWGYQPVGMYAPTARFGSPDGFARLVNHAHENGIGVILDWVPAHFPTDAHGLAMFDGTTLYEHSDRRRGFHPDWNTAIYDFGRGEVAGFLINNALFWLEHYHLDGLRVDAVASMLHLNYSRSEGQWEPNQEGGSDNIEAIAFIKKLNQIIHERVPSALMIAEESTSFPKVSQHLMHGGLGFNFKWDLGFMHDTLDYFSLDPVFRKYHHDKLTFNQMYAYSEHFVLPLSHDEVVHGKSSLIHKMHGDDWQKFANLRAYYAYMWGYPGKKLLFMGQEFAQRAEWNENQSLDWHLTQYHEHSGVQRLISDLNHLYRSSPALYEREHSWDGFEWRVVDDHDQSVIGWLRRGEKTDQLILVVSNLTPVPHHGYEIRVPQAGVWHEAINTDATTYGGSGMGNLGQALTQTRAWPQLQPVHQPANAPISLAPHQPAHTPPLYIEHVLTLCLPPLATLIFEWRA